MNTLITRTLILYMLILQALLELLDSGALKHFDEERILVLAENGKLYVGIFIKRFCRLWLNILRFCRIRFDNVQVKSLNLKSAI